MKKKMYLKRSENAPEFMDNHLGLYPNLILKGVLKENNPGKILHVKFEAYAHNPLRRVSHLDVNFVFNTHNILDKMNEDNTAYIDVGVPNESHARDNYIDIDDNGVYITNPYAEAWFRNQNRVHIPNGIGENNFIKFEFMTNEEIETLVYHEEN